MRKGRAWRNGGSFVSYAKSRQSETGPNQDLRNRLANHASAFCRRIKM